MLILKYILNQIKQHKSLQDQYKEYMIAASGAVAGK